VYTQPEVTFELLGGGLARSTPAGSGSATVDRADEDLVSLPGHLRTKGLDERAKIC
jgi:hypothetical protein